MNKIDVEKLLETLKAKPEDYEQIEGDFEPIENSVIKIYLVKDKKNNFFIKKEFQIDEDDDDESANSEPTDDKESDNSVDNDDDSDLYDHQGSYSYDPDCTPTNTIKYFKREVENLIKVQIKNLPFLNIVGYNYQIGNNYPFIITKQLKGNTLAQLISKNFQDCENQNTIKMIIFYGVAFALKILHGMKIIHRDIKPENIFLNESYEPFLGDFGFARVIQESPKLTENVGTTFYMAQELLNNDSDVKPSEKIDSYSYAVTILETLTLDLTIKNSEGKILKKNNSSEKENYLSVQEFRKLSEKGYKYIIPEDNDDIVPTNYKLLIEECWSQNSDERWPMEKIVDMMENKELELPGYDEEKFFKYVNKLKDAERKNEPISFKPKKSSRNKFKPKTVPV